MTNLLTKTQQVINKYQQDDSLTDRQMAELIGCSHQLVYQLRRSRKIGPIHGVVPVPIPGGAGMAPEPIQNVESAVDRLERTAAPRVESVRVPLHGPRSKPVVERAKPLRVTHHVVFDLEPHESRLLDEYLASREQRVSFNDFVERRRITAAGLRNVIRRARLQRDPRIDRIDQWNRGIGQTPRVEETTNDAATG